MVDKNMSVLKFRDELDVKINTLRVVSNFLEVILKQEREEGGKFIGHFSIDCADEAISSLNDTIQAIENIGLKAA